MCFGTEPRLLKAVVCSRLCRGNRSCKWDVRAVGRKGREGRDNSVTGKGCAGGRSGEREEESSLSHLPPPLLHYPLPLDVSVVYCLLTILSCTSWNQVGQDLLMGQEIEGLKASPIAGEGSDSNPWEQILCSCCHWHVGRRAAVASGGQGERSCVGKYSFSCLCQLLALPTCWLCQTRLCFIAFWLWSAVPNQG